MNADDRASRLAARWLRSYADAEMSTAGGIKPSVIAESVALICRNLADGFEKDVTKLSHNLHVAEREVIAAAREGRPTQDAILALDAAQHAIDQARRKYTVRRLAGDAA